MHVSLPYSNSSLILKKKVLQEFYHEFLLKLHNGRISFARLNKSIHKLWGLVKTMTIEICQSRNNHKYDKKIVAATNNNKQNNRTTKNHHTSTLQKTQTERDTRHIPKPILY